MNNLVTNIIDFCNTFHDIWFLNNILKINIHHQTTYTSTNQNNPCVFMNQITSLIRSDCQKIHKTIWDKLECIILKNLVIFPFSFQYF
jgi:hypothetical protein